MKPNYVDSNPTGCNCLVVEEAFPNSTTVVNYSQFDGVAGSVTGIAFYGSDQSTFCIHTLELTHCLLKITLLCFSMVVNPTAANDKTAG